MLPREAHRGKVESAEERFYDNVKRKVFIKRFSFLFFLKKT